jgi:hypothetical protein
LIAPLSSGLNDAELEHLRRYVRAGGNLLVGGDALPFPSSGKGKVVHLVVGRVTTRGEIRGANAASGDAAYKNSLDAVDRLAGPAPIVVQPPENRVILTRQAKYRRWVLHLLDDGPCTIEIRREFANATKITHQYPTSGWTCAAEKTPTGLRIKASGPASDRLVVLE